MKKATLFVAIEYDIAERVRQLAKSMDVSATSVITSILRKSLKLP